MPKIALVSCVMLPEPDPDEQITLEAFAKSGIDASLAAWDDPSVDWRAFDIAILRSAWNYYEDELAFRQWLEVAGRQTRLFNSSSVVLHNIDKTYLAELERSGIEIVPTRFLSTEETLSDVLSQTQWQEFVIKPTVSAGSFMTQRFNRFQLEEAETFVRDLCSTHRAMVQEFMALVEKGGEIALIHVDGELTHGVVKEPRFAGGEESVSSACQPNQQQRALAKKVIEAIGEPWLYARVDLMASTDDRWLLSELELIEPSLFFLQHPPSLDRFVAAVSRLLNDVTARASMLKS